MPAPEFDTAPGPNGLGHAQARRALQARDYDSAQAILTEALARRPDDTDALCLLALALWRGPGDLQRAAVHLDRARTLRPDDARILSLCASLHLHLGELDSAMQFAEQAVAAEPNHTPAYVVMARARPGRVHPDHLQRMQMLGARPQLGPKALRPLHNAIGRVFDAQGDFDSAFHHFTLSNRLAAGRYAPALRDARLDNARAFFTPERIRRRAGWGIEGAGCVFVIGMLRSGSTLIEQLLAAHPETDSCNETDALSNNEASWLRALPGQQARSGGFEHYLDVDAAKIERSARAYLAATSRQMRTAQPRRRIDKRLGNFLFMPLIALLFPDAVVLHTHRHPLDVCLSCYSQGFDGHVYSNDLIHLAHFYRNYQGYLRLWAGLYPTTIRHCRYEDVVADFEPQARRIVSAVGLAWHDACAQPHLAQRYVNSASAAQVREPVHGTRRERWRGYEKHLQPLIDALGGHAEIERLHREFT